ncbi:PH domain-containing protein [Streptomyces albidus (ex Kaewkla and Franco 2022)]|uniref:PH domain-containing protein n=1 Tax=Streptomyces albidus (ex Kaewkla and Franco 2022) TaxID=722709 RepID=UPI0015EE8234|nr:PH domain-containing protein [Streptomyces albidus (ex Kaewkla and Franco 2022)]
MSSESRPEREPEDGHEPTSESGGPASAPGAADGSATEPESAPDQSEDAPEAAQEPAPPVYADHCYRSPGAMAGGVLLLLLACWLAFDALVTGTDRTKLTVLAGLVFGVPLVVAYTLRPAVYANPQRMRVRNPFRTVTVPWGTVESVQSGYSSEVVADGTKYQLWSIPVSLRARKRAARQTERAERDASRGANALARPRGLFGLGGVPGAVEDGSEKRAPSDQAIDELRALAFDNSESPAAQGQVAVRWAYEIAAPVLAGAIALAALLATR